MSLIVRSTIGSDGILHLDIPMGKQEANKEVQVTVEPIVRKEMTPEEWRAWVAEMAGSWQGDFEGSEQQFVSRPKPSVEESIQILDHMALQSLGQSLPINFSRADIYEDHD